VTVCNVNFSAFHFNELNDILCKAMAKLNQTRLNRAVDSLATIYLSIISG